MAKSSDASKDKELTDSVTAAANALAKVMNEAASYGLLIDITMKSHSCVSDLTHVYERGDFRPIISVRRVTHYAT